MIRAVITVRPAGAPGLRFTGLFKTAIDATLFAIEQLGERPGKLSVNVAQ